MVSTTLTLNNPKLYFIVSELLKNNLHLFLIKAFDFVFLGLPEET